MTRPLYELTGTQVTALVLLGAVIGGVLWECVFTLPVRRKLTQVRRDRDRYRARLIDRRDRRGVRTQPYDRRAS
jgi:hypothetical protein